jgi:hypothetical protein
LSTWSWDWGIVSHLGLVGECFGNGAFRLRPAALPCVVIHPIDVDRGYLPRIVRIIDGLRRQGRRPVTFARLAAPSLAEASP